MHGHCHAFFAYTSYVMLPCHDYLFIFAAAIDAVSLRHAGCLLLLALRLLLMLRRRMPLFAVVFAMPALLMLPVRPPVRSIAAMPLLSLLRCLLVAPLMPLRLIRFFDMPLSLRLTLRCFAVITRHAAAMMLLMACCRHGCRYDSR